MQQMSIEQQAIQRYQENLLFFRQFHPHIYAKVSSLDVALEKGYYKERYSLEYKDEGYFDVVELESGAYLYSKDSYRYAKEVADAIDFKKVDNLFETFYNLKFDEVDESDLLTQDLRKYSYSTIISLVNFSNRYASKEKTTMKKLYKFVFVGVGLGTHLIEVDQKLQSNVYLIVEDDLELFRLSLFVTNYKELTAHGAKLFFAVFSDEHEFRVVTQNFLYEQFVYNHYIKFFHMLHHTDKRLKDIQNIILTQTYLTFNYSALMTSLLRPLEYIKNGYKILNIATSYESSLLTQKPLLIVGAGPSFDANIEWLKANHSKFIVVIVSALMAKFEEVGIKPDIITHVHGFADAMPHIEKVKDMRFFDQTISLFGGMSYPAFTQKFKKENVYIIEGSSRYKEGFDGITSSNIGSLTYGLMLKFRVKNIYLLGLDFALDQETGLSHAQVHAHTKKHSLELHEEVGGGVDVKEEIVAIEGNFAEEVLTTVQFNSMRVECENISKTYKQDVTTTYNLSSGAKILDTTPLTLESIEENSLEALDKELLYSELRKDFDANAQNYLTEKELDDLEERLKYYDSVIQRLELHLSLEHNNVDQLHYNLLGTFHDILSEDHNGKYTSDMNYILTLFLQFVSGYIFDLINTKEIEFESEIINQINNITIPQLIRVVSYFRESIVKMELGVKDKE